MKTLSAKLTTTCLAALALAASAAAQVSNTKEALAVALKNETIAAAGDKMKLYMVSGNYNGASKRWSFQFYDGGANVHTVSVNEKGKANYYSRDKGSTRVFDDLDFSKLPAPGEVLVDDSINKAKAALEALGFKPITDGKLYISYYVRSEYRQKDKPVHDWKVTLPTGDGKQGKVVGFKNGTVDTVMNSSIRN